MTIIFAEYFVFTKRALQEKKFICSQNLNNALHLWLLKQGGITVRERW